MTTKLPSLATLILLSFLNSQLSSVLAQGTAFTYQGRLNDGTGPANGLYDLQFDLYSVASGGSPLTAALIADDLTITNGLFTVTLDFSGASFDGGDRWLEIGVRPGASAGAYTNLAPRQQLTSTPYAIRAANFSGAVAASQITGNLASSNIGAGTITSTNLAAGAAVANLNASGQSGVASGGVVLSATENAALAAAGYVKIGTMQGIDTWQQRSPRSLPAGRSLHTAVWTGSEMIVWGGSAGTSAYFNDGARYNPATDNWTAISTNGAPVARQDHTAVWSGTEMIIWGGRTNTSSGSEVNSGGRYNPVANAWSAIVNSPLLLARYGHTAVWTGAPCDEWAAKCDFLEHRLRAIPKPAGVFAFRDADAANVLDACDDARLAVPEEIAILGADNNEMICETLRVPLSSINHDLEGLGYEGAALLQSLMQGQRAPKRPKLVPPKGITVRRSTEVLAIHHEPTRRGLQFLQENYRRPTGAEDGARASGLTRRKLELAFREHLGRSISDQLTALRILRAKELLMRTSLRVADVAAQTGFNTPQYFNNVFRRSCGLTPRRFRLRHRPPSEAQ